MARKKRVMYNFEELYRQDKLDDMIFAFFEGTRDAIPTAQLTKIAANFQKKWKLDEDSCAIDIILASYHRSLAKYQKLSTINDD